jgi:hypothetical protein
MALTPVNPSTGLPNINPSYFPAFTQTWVIPPFPPVGDGNFAFGPIVVSVQRLPTVRVPPYTVGPAPAPPPIVGTFATWDDVVAEIEENGVNPNDQFIVQANGVLPLGMWTYTGAAVAPGETDYEINPAEWQQSVAPLLMPTEEPAPSGKTKRRSRSSR